tara:strand:- start:1322 stop:1927 length:606 start_codon:yes stop_codon:yes gene_type:complete
MARTSKSRGLNGFEMRSGNASPYKFLGKAIKKFAGSGVGKVLMAPATAIGGAVGMNTDASGGSGNQNPNEAIAQGQAMGAGLGNTTGVTPPPGTSAMVQKKSPLKATDAILVKGAYDAASGMGTAKYGAISAARAWTSGVNTVERTVNDSSAAQAKKDRTRNKRFTKSEWKKQKWFNRKHEGWKDDIRWNTDGSRDFNNQS